MIVLVTGATGFIGSRVARALHEAGHEVVCVMRGVEPDRDLGPGWRVVQLDFNEALDPADWWPAVSGVDIVVNAVGIVRETPGQTFERLHVRAPQALFRACVQAGVKRVVQISALGADERAGTRYHASKHAADRALLGLPINAVIVQPSLAFGPDGASARLFTMLASLPLIPLPAGGHQKIQPIHVDDLVECIVQLVAHDLYAGRRVPLVGPRPLSLRSYLEGLRAAMGLRRGRYLRIARGLMDVAARAGSATGALFNVETWRMLRRGSTADASAAAHLLGRPARGVADFVAPHERAGVLALARLDWLLPLLRWSLALMWIGSGLVSLGLYPVDDSLAMLARTPVPPAWGLAALYGAAALDLLLGLLALLRPGRRLWTAQIVLVLTYTLILTLYLPELWLHPFGPVLKNLPVLAALLTLQAFEPPRR